MFETPEKEIDILAALKYLASLQITRLAILGGGELVASFLESDLIDEIIIYLFRVPDRYLE